MYVIWTEKCRCNDAFHMQSWDTPVQVTPRYAGVATSSTHCATPVMGNGIQVSHLTVLHAEVTLSLSLFVFWVGRFIIHVTDCWLAGGLPDP